MGQRPVGPNFVLGLGMGWTQPNPTRIFPGWVRPMHTPNGSLGRRSNYRERVLPGCTNPKSGSYSCCWFLEIVRQPATTAAIGAGACSILNGKRS